MKILSEYLESLVKGFDPSRPVFFRKNVTDCEHWGDMADARAGVEEFIAPYGGEVSDEYWDGNDCGEAYIECKVPCGRAREVMENGFFYYDPWQ